MRRAQFNLYFVVKGTSSSIAIPCIPCGFLHCLNIYVTNIFMWPCIFVSLDLVNLQSALKTFFFCPGKFDFLYIVCVSYISCTGSWSCSGLKLKWPVRCRNTNFPKLLLWQGEHYWQGYNFIISVTMRYCVCCIVKKLLKVVGLHLYWNKVATSVRNFGVITVALLHYCMLDS
jgi:hypothetical protein